MEYIRKKLFIVILIIGGFHLQAQSYYKSLEKTNKKGQMSS